MTDATPEIDLRPDGTVNLTFTLPKKKAWKGTLRRPTIGELRHLEESLGRANDSVSDALARLPQFPKAPSKEKEPGQEKALEPEEFLRLREEYEVLRGEYRKASDEFSAISTDTHATWFRGVVETVCEGSPLPDDNGDLPPWAVMGSLGPILLNHWSAVPLSVATR